MRGWTWTWSDSKLFHQSPCVFTVLRLLSFIFLKFVYGHLDLVIHLTLGCSTSCLAVLLRLPSFMFLFIYSLVIFLCFR